MTEKRFVLEDILYVYDNGKLLGAREVVEVMNNLHEENEQLKQQLQSILKLTRKIEDCTHDIKLIGDFE